jgi:hypothetical protein
MMKNLLLCFVVILISTWSLGQNKKEQIESLLRLSDSLQNVIDRKNDEIIKIENNAQELSQFLNQKDKEISDLNQNIQKLNAQKSSTKKSFDSLQIVVNKLSESSSPLSSKKQILTHLIGRHNLRSISGFMGANTLFDTDFDNGKWKSNSSNLEMGMRELYENSLVKSDINFLDGFNIQIDSNLTIYLKSGTKIIFTSKFNENGLDYNVSKAEGIDLHEQIAALSPSTIFMNDELILFAKNNIDLSNIINGNFDAITGDLMILSYNLFDSRFELSIFQNDCCNGNTFYFEKSQLY